MAKKYYANLFVVDDAATPAENIKDKFAGQTIEVGGLLLLAPGQAATVAAVATAAATDLATSQALANQLKTSVNAILSSLKAAKLMA